MQKIEVNKGERCESDKHEGNATEGRKQFETVKVEHVKVEMTRIRRRFAKFEGHVEGIRQEMGQAKDILGQIKRDIEELDNYILSVYYYTLNVYRMYHKENAFLFKKNCGAYWS